jgi:uncharacterized membrane protein
MDSKCRYPAAGTEPLRQDKIPPSSVSQQPGTEICDVCGYVNRGYALVCRQCDVPLPSSVISFKGSGL